MRFSRRATLAVLGGLLLSLSAPAQTKTPTPAAKPPASAAPSQSTPMKAAPAQAAKPAAQPRQRVVLIDPIRVYDPFFDYPYPYAYAPEYMSENFGYVKLETKMKEASVYVDGGYADKVDKAKKFALRPGTHDIELRDSDGRKIFQQRVAVIVGKTTKVQIG